MSFAIAGATIAGIATAGATIYGANVAADAAKKASNTQADAAQSAIDLQKEQYAKVQELLNPYVQAGSQALTQQQDILGANGPEAQQKAYDAIQNSSAFQAMAKQGETGILQNASATGGVRGGNTQGALAQFRPAMLNSLIEQQYSRLSGLSAQGQNAAAGVGASGQGMANQVSGLLSDQGQAVAGGQMAQGTQAQSMVNALTSGIGTFTGLGGPAAIAQAQAAAKAKAEADAAIAATKMGRF